MNNQILVVCISIGLLGISESVLAEEKDSASAASQSFSSSQSEAGSGSASPSLSAFEGLPKDKGLGSLGGLEASGYGPLLASLLPGLQAAGASQSTTPSHAFPGMAGTGGLGGLGGYFGIPGFVGPSYVPSSLIGSVLGAKGDILFPIVIFVFVVVGIWTVVQFLIGLIVPLIAGKLKEGKSLLEHGRRSRREVQDPWEEHSERLDQATQDVLPALDTYQQQYEPKDTM